jgi:hypothetical protein
MANELTSRRAPPRHVALGALATGAIAGGALALGAVAIGALAIGRLAVRKGTVRSLHIEELTVDRLRIREQLPAGRERPREAHALPRITPSIPPFAERLPERSELPGS